MAFNHKRSAPLPKNRLIIGRKPLLEALLAGKNIEKIFVLQSAGGPEINEIRTAAKAQNIPVSSVPAEKLQRFTQANHQGVIAIAGLIQYHELQNVIDLAVDAGKTPLIIVADGITDTRNLGAIARSCHCYGADALVLPMSNTAAITEDAVKTSAGALESLPVCRTPSVEQAMDTLRLNGIAVYASALEKTSKKINEVDMNLPLAFVLGAEDKGVSKFVLSNADQLVQIPMNSDFDSLNVSVAAGILLYECFQKRS